MEPVLIAALACLYLSVGIVSTVIETYRRGRGRSYFDPENAAEVLGVVMFWPIYWLWKMVSCGLDKLHWWAYRRDQAAWYKKTYGGR